MQRRLVCHQEQGLTTALVALRCCQICHQCICTVVSIGDSFCGRRVYSRPLLGPDMLFCVQTRGRTTVSFRSTVGCSMGLLGLRRLAVSCWGPFRSDTLPACRSFFLLLLLLFWCAYAGDIYTCVYMLAACSARLWADCSPYLLRPAGFFVTGCAAPGMICPVLLFVM